MTPYEVGFPGPRFEKDFEKALRRISTPYQLAIREAIQALSEDPRPPGKKVKALAGDVVVRHFTASLRLRVGPYRILYDVDDQNRKVVLLALRKREESTYR